MMKKAADTLVRKHSQLASWVLNSTGTRPSRLARSLAHLVRSFDSMCFVGSLCASFGYTLTTGRSALTDAKAWLGATTMTDDGVLMERENRRYQMRLSR